MNAFIMLSVRGCTRLQKDVPLNLGTELVVDHMQEQERSEAMLHQNALLAWTFQLTRVQKVHWLAGPGNILAQLR
jgi:hypothetical protein